MMVRYVTLLVLLLGFTAPVHAGEVDGKGIICHKQEDSGKIYNVPIFFENGWALAIELDKLTISKRRIGEYRTSSSSITWKIEFGAGESVEDSLDRKTLTLYTVVHTPGARREFTYLFYECEVTNWAGIEKHLQPEIDKTREEMKDNKI